MYNNKHKRSKILVIGESCTDEYIYGTCDRVCPEAASLCFRDSGVFSKNKGMSGNVYENLRVINNDLSIDHITQKNNIIKRRFIDKKYNTIVFRQDINDSCDKIKCSDYNFSIYDYIIISDYCKGFLDYSDIEYICKNKKSECVVFIDTKKKIVPSLVKNIDFIKINNKEFENNIDDINPILETSSLIVTQGENGAVLYNKKDSSLENKYSSKIQYFATHSVILRDVCGAGDTFLSGLTAKYIESSDIEESIIFANTCACAVVAKFGVSTP